MDLNNRKRARIGPNDYARRRSARRADDTALVFMCIIIFVTMCYSLTTL